MNQSRSFLQVMQNEVLSRKFAFSFCFVFSPVRVTYSSHKDLKLVTRLESPVDTHPVGSSSRRSVLEMRLNDMSL